MLFIQSRGLTRIIFTLVITTFLVLQTYPISAGQIYKWRDEQGRIHFSDTPVDETTELIKETKDPEPASAKPENSPTKEHLDPKDEKSEPAVINIPYIAKEGYASRVIVEATLNGHVTARLLVDTGAPGLIISDRLAYRLNLFDKDGSQLLVFISGIGGYQFATRTIIDKITIENISAEVIPAHISTSMSNAYDGLVGMDVLSGYAITIDPEKEQLVARKIPPSPKRLGGYYKSWWQGKFREFRQYKEYWDHHAELLEKVGSPYSRMIPKKRERYERFILHQKDEADHLFRKFGFKANNARVPGHWRR